MTVPIRHWRCEACGRVFFERPRDELHHAQGTPGTPCRGPIVAVEYVPRERP